MQPRARLTLLLSFVALGSSACAESRAGSDDGRAWQPSPPRSGAVTASVEDGEVTVVAWFDAERPACQTRTDGACTVERCLGWDPASVRNAGWITAATAAGTRTFELRSDGTYDDVSLPWTPGPVAITATGGDVPPFAGSLAPPRQPLLTQPVVPLRPPPPNSGPPPIPVDIMLDPDEDLDVAWAPFDGQARVSLRSLAGSVTCEADGRGGRISVSAGVLADIAGDPLPILLDLYALSSQELDLQTWSVRLELEARGILPDGRRASANVGVR